MDFKKISVLIVTYKQADVIGRNIESILQQKEYGLHEIVICDDCSPDNNWEVIQRYVEKYPKIIRAYRNNPNLGIYGNSNKLITLAGEADLFCWLEGDDALCNGFFKKVQEAIDEQQIDVTKRICIQANYKSISPRGEELICDNSFLSRKGCSPLGAKLRALTTWRATLFSKAVLSDFRPADITKGLYLAENMFDNEWFVNTERAYFINYTGSIYYNNIGVSVNLKDNDCDYLTTEAMTNWLYWMNNNSLSWEDKIYAKSQYALAKLRTSHSFIDYLTYLYNYCLGNFSYRYNWHQMFTTIRLCFKRRNK